MPRLRRRSAGRRRLAPATAVLATALLCAGCQALPTDPTSAKNTAPATIRVPSQAATINAALDRSRPGDLVLVSPGVYHESVRIRTERVILRGTDRGSVVIDGQGRRANGVTVTAPGVSVENLTVRNHLLNGVLVTGMSDGNGGLARGSNGYRHLDPAEFPR